jgi:signal transduction histidine kinase
MDQQNSAENKEYGSLEYWKTRPPEELLEAFINELRGPFASIKGYIEMMRLSDSEEIRVKALDIIPEILDRIEKEEEQIKEYLVDLKNKSSQKP